MVCHGRCFVANRSAAGVEHTGYCCGPILVMTTDNDVVKRQQGRRVLLLIAGIPLSMMLAATLLWWAVAEGQFDIVGAVGTANHGELIVPPKSVSQRTFSDDGDADLLWEDLPLKWHFLVVHRGDVCEAACQEQLYQTRQIHIALGKEFNRVGRVVLTDLPADLIAVTSAAETPSAAASTFDGTFADWMAAEHAGVTALTLPAAEIEQLMPSTLGDNGHWYVVDPAGWIMMQVANDLYYKDVISDLRFLLKNSGS